MGKKCVRRERDSNFCLSEQGWTSMTQIPSQPTPTTASLETPESVGVSVLQQSVSPTSAPAVSRVRALANGAMGLLTREIHPDSVEEDAAESLADSGDVAVSGELLAEAFDRSPDALFIADTRDGIIYRCNQSGADWLGEERDALVGRPFASIFAKSDGCVASRFWQEPNRDLSVILTLMPSNPSLAPRTIELRSASLSYNEESWVILSARDLGTNQPNGHSCSEEQDSMKIPIRSLRDGLVVLSKRGEILFTNPAIEQMFEPSELPKVCREWMTDFAEHDQAGILGFSSPYEGQTLELSLNDGRTFLLTRSFLFEPQGAASVMLVAKDITELRLLQQKGHQLEMELLRESKLAEFGTMAAGIAHNLNGPLTSILGSCELMAMTQGKTPDMERIRTQATVMKDIIEILVRKCRQEQNPEPQEICIVELIETEWKFLQANLFFKHDVEKRIELDQTAPKIWAVYADLSQAVGNLLRNAIDALYGREEKRLFVRTRHSDRFLFVEIEDTGIGIKQEDMPKLFNPFFTTKPLVGKGAPGQPTGTGLGLSMSRSILARYGAEILVDSEWQKGSTFTIRFPFSQPESLGCMKL